MKKSQVQQTNRAATSIGIIFGSFLLTYVPIPGLQQNVVIVSGTELQEPLQ